MQRRVRRGGHACGTGTGRIISFAQDGGRISWIGYANGFTSRPFGRGEAPSWAVPGQWGQERVVLRPGFAITFWHSRASNGTVEIRGAIDGALLATFSPVGTVRALGLSGPRAVVLVEVTDGSKRIERYDATTGALLGATQVSPLVANVIDTAAGWIVYRTGRAIRLMDAVTGAKQLLVTARATPLGLSIESRRVAWAENRLSHGRVRSVLAPAHP